MDNVKSNSQLSKKAFSSCVSCVETITPERARELLKQNINNRVTSETNVRYLMKQFSDGKWMLNGESIKIAESGEILDGQHRLKACIRAGISFVTMVVYNVPVNSKHTMDTGKNRSATDVLSFSVDGKYIGRLSSVSKFIMNFERGAFGTAASNSGRGGQAKHTSPDNTDVLNFVLNTEGFQYFVEHSTKIHYSGDRCVPPKLFTGLHWIISQKANEELADSFFTTLSTGIGVLPENPIFILRRKLISMKMDSKNIDKLSHLQTLWAIVKTWNYWVTKKRVKKLMYDTKPVEIETP